MTTTDQGTQFEASDEAFFNAAYDDAPVSERPITLDLEPEEPETDEPPLDPIASERLRARRARLTQSVAEIVATLAILSSTAFGMHLVRGSAASSSVAAAASSSSSQYATALSTAAAANVTPMAVSFSAQARAVDRGKMSSTALAATPSWSGDALKPSERSRRAGDTRRARPATSDSARLRLALRRYRPAAASRSTTPGS